MVAPHLVRNPACSTAGSTPSSSRTGRLAGSRDSPTWCLGNLALSKSDTRTPWRANMVAVVLPAGPPPIIMTSESTSWLFEAINRFLNTHSRGLPHGLLHLAPDSIDPPPPTVAGAKGDQGFKTWVPLTLNLRTELIPRCDAGGFLGCLISLYLPFSTDRNPDCGLKNEGDGSCQLKS